MVIGALLVPTLIFAAVLLFASIRVINQYERGVILTFGRYTGTFDPGLRLLVPIIQRMIKVDIRLIAVDVPDQDCITKDNVSVKVNAVLYYRVSDSRRAVIDVQDFHYTVSQLAQTTMRDTVGEVVLDDLLSKREEISNRIRKIVDAATDPWGIKVDSVDLKHIELPHDMVRTMAKAAEADRERQAVIIKAEGELAASENMARAAHMLNSTPGALHLRTLQSLNDLSSDQSNTIVFAIPLEILRAFEGLAKKK